eukprot:6181717-Pleurochrysis_carterae.AAC.4
MKAGGSVVVAGMQGPRPLQPSMLLLAQTSFSTPSTLLTCSPLIVTPFPSRSAVTPSTLPPTLPSHMPPLHPAISSTYSSYPFLLFLYSVLLFFNVARNSSQFAWHLTVWSRAQNR